MKKRLFAILLALLIPLGLLAGCGASEALDAAGSILELLETQAPAETRAPAITEAPPQTEAPETLNEPPEETAGSAAAIPEDGEYSAPEDVAEYLHTYGHLPSNFITKREAQALGWPGGDLWKYAPGKSIGGDRFGNYEGALPEGASYHECDVNYTGGSRGAERLVYGDDGSVWYTNDHYASFTRLY